MRYIDLMGGQKPHLLVSVTNNLGAETVIQYAPSTKFYVADKLGRHALGDPPAVPRAGCRAGGELRLRQPQSFVTRYAYHHGYYDGVEREFRGFGRVDQWDTEELCDARQLHEFARRTNVAGSSNVPPVWTKTWFHTGAFFGEAGISRYLEQEYYAEGDSSDAVAGLTQAQLEAMLLPDTVLPTDILLPDGTRVAYTFSPEELREACRSLRGSILRQEVYALDGTDESDRPYSRVGTQLHHRGLPAAGPEPVRSVLLPLAGNHRLSTTNGSSIRWWATPSSTRVRRRPLSPRPIPGSAIP